MWWIISPSRCYTNEQLVLVQHTRRSSTLKRDHIKQRRSVITRRRSFRGRAAWVPLYAPVDTIVGHQSSDLLSTTKVHCTSRVHTWQHRGTMYMCTYVYITVQTCTTGNRQLSLTSIKSVQTGSRKDVPLMTYFFKRHTSWIISNHS